MFPGGMMSSEVLKKFGRYFLLDLIAQGGMAEIYRARLATKDGAGRLVVVKRIQAGFGANIEFLQMFKSEIKVTMGFNHPNIVQVYDFGEEQNQPFITMELVDGKNLRQLLNRFKEANQPFPVELAAAIIEQAASGLHYAHTYKDKISGDPLNIVHRDISPQNILISYEGGVKIIDFGIAKATTNSEHTRAGVIKGKPSYLAPEQISGDPLDGRTDLFSLGTVFWELLVGRKLFAGENDLAVLKMIESCSATVRMPSDLNPSVPKDLDMIVLRLLAKSPEKRFQTGEEVARALRRFLHHYAPEFAPSDLSAVAKELFQREIVEDRKKIQRLNDRVEQLMQNEVPDIVAPTAAPNRQRPEETTTFVARPTGLPKGPVEIKVDDDVKNQPPLMIERPTREARPRPGTRHVTPAPGSGTFSPNHTNGGRSSGSFGGTFGGTPTKSGGYGWKGFAATAALLAGVSWVGPKMGFEVPVLSRMVGSTIPDRIPASDVPAEPKEDPQTKSAPTGETKAVASAAAKLRLNIFPEGVDGKISVNGKFIDSANPVTEVPMDEPLELLVQRPGFESFRSEFKIDSRSLGAEGEYVKQISLVPEQRGPASLSKDFPSEMGFLSVRSTPGADVRIYVNGKHFKTQYAPFEMVKVPVGKISLHLYNSTLDLEDQITLEIEKKDQTKRVQSTLKPRPKK
jgi:serine/threonine-protein kinase